MVAAFYWRSNCIGMVLDWHWYPFTIGMVLVSVLVCQRNVSGRASGRGLHGFGMVLVWYWNFTFFVLVWNWYS